MDQPTKQCPRCKRELKADAPGGLCPACLMEINLQSGLSQPSARGRAAPLPVEEVGERFPEMKILGLLGSGGMGAVYKARQRKLDRLVALKILSHEADDAGFIERFTREAQTLARLDHPNIVAVHDFGERDGIFFLIMELVDGVTLRDLLSEGRLKPEQALAIVPPICEALQFAHEKGVVHRDIKPENILMDRAGVVKVADFGIARMAGLEGDKNLTGEGQVIGTAHYMAPEQVERPAEVDHRADIFAVGVVFYEMLTGELPLGRFLQPSKKVLIDVRLDEIVLRALENQPALRYQTASELKTSVETMGGTPPGRAAVPEAGRWSTALVVLFFVAGVCATANMAYALSAARVNWILVYGWGIGSVGFFILGVRYLLAARSRNRIDEEANKGSGKAKPSRSWAECHAGMPKLLWIALVTLGISAVANLILIPSAGAIGVFDAGFKSLLILGLWYRFRTAFALTLLAVLIAAIASFNVSIWFGLAVTAVHGAVVFPLVRSTRWFFPDMTWRVRMPPWLRRSAGRKAWICFLLAAAAFALMAVALSGNAVDWPTVYFWMSLCAALTLLGLLFVWMAGKRAMRIFGGIVGVGVVIGLAALFLLERPRMIDSRGEHHTRDGRYIAFASTWRAMRMFGNDDIFYRFRLVESADGGQGRLVKEWDVPHRPLPRPPHPRQGSMNAPDYMAKVDEWNEATSRPFSDLLFEHQGQIDWSEDARRVTFRVGDREISAFDIESGEVTLGGFLPEREVVLKGSPRLQNAFLDLDTGKIMSAPGEWVEALRTRGQLYDGHSPASIVREWMSTSGADLFVRVAVKESYDDMGNRLRGLDAGGLLQIDGMVVYMSPESFPFDTISGEQIVRAIERHEEGFADPVGAGESFWFPLKPGAVNAFKTREGRFGVMEVEEEARGRVRVRFKLLPEAFSSAEPPFVAEYGRGTVELVALAPHPSTDGQAWLPNGDPTDEPFPERRGESSVEGRAMKEIAFRIQSEKGTASFPATEYGSGSAVLGQGGSYLQETMQNAGRLFVQVIACNPEAKQTNVRVGIADGTWEEVLSLPFGADHLVENTQQSGEDGIWIAGFQGIAGDAGEVALSLRYSKQDEWETRMVSLKEDGGVAPLKGGRSDVSRGLIQTMVSLSPEEAAEIDQIQLQRRKYEWVEFQNVSLEPGHRTKVKVSDVGGEKQTRAESNGSPEQEAFTFSHRPKLGQALLDASRDFVTEHQWKLEREGGGERNGILTVTIEGTDLAGRRVTFEVAAQAEGKTARFSVNAEPGSEFTPHRIGTKIARRVGHVAGWAKGGDEASAPSESANADLVRSKVHQEDWDFWGEWIDPPLKEIHDTLMSNDAPGALRAQEKLAAANKTYTERFGRKAALPAAFIEAIEEMGPVLQKGDLQRARELRNEAERGFTPEYVARFARLAGHEESARATEVENGLVGEERQSGEFPATPTPSDRPAVPTAHQDALALFGPVRELTLKSPIEDRAHAFFDFDSGRIVVPPEGLSIKDQQRADYDDLWEWAIRQGVEGQADTSEQVRGLLWFGVSIAPVPDAEWEGGTAQSIEASVNKRVADTAFAHVKFSVPQDERLRAAVSANTLTTYAEQSRTFAFRTSEGRLGLLQLLEVTDEPRGSVKFRYKLVQL